MVNEEGTVPLVLIGGAARVGKTTLVRKLLNYFPYYSLSMDDLKYMIKKLGFIEKQLSSKDFYDPDKWLEKIRKRDFTIWQWTKQYIISSLNNNSPLIVEGGLWADYISENITDFTEVNNKVKVIVLFIVDSTNVNEAAERFLSLKQTDPYNWLNKYNEEQLSLYAECNKLRTDNIIELAEKYGYLVYDIDDYESMDKMQDVIINDLKGLI